MVLPWEQNRWVVPNLLQAPGANLKTIAVHYSCQNFVLLKSVEFITWKLGSYVQPWVNQAQLIMHQAFIRLWGIHSQVCFYLTLVRRSGGMAR